LDWLETKYQNDMKKLNLWKVCIAGLLCVGSATQYLHADDGAQKVEALIATMGKSNHVVPQEKVYLHFDNTGYFAGETIWFKAYVICSDKDNLGSKSKVLYVELVDPTGTVVETKKLKIENGQANGDFPLTDKILSGFFKVRAYTRYMLNWGTDAIFSRVLPIFESPQKKGDYARQVMDAEDLKGYLPDKTIKEDGIQKKVNVRFYPEGGNLVRGLQSRVAFDVCDKNGNALDAEGYLVKDGNQTEQVRTLREGRGSFLYTPDDKTRLELTIKGGGKRSFKLPFYITEGCVMTMDVSQNDAVRTVIACTDGMVGKTLGQVFLRDGRVVHKELLRMDGRLQTLTLPKDSLPAGVNQVVLIDEDGVIQSDRLIFIYPAKSSEKINISFADNNSWPHKKMTMEVRTQPNATCSMAVTDAETMTEGFTHNAATWLLLTSDLRGYINHPEYYLEQDDQAHRAAADLLMLVQGWRRYDPAVLEGKKKFTLRYLPEDKLYLNGQLHAYSKRNTVDNVALELSMQNRSGDRLRGNTTTDKNGYYAFGLPDCYGTWKTLMFTEKNDKLTNYYVGIDRQFSPAVRATDPDETTVEHPSFPLYNFNLDPSYTDSIPMDMKTHWLENITVTGQKNWVSARAYRQDEGLGNKNAVLHYDCLKAAEAIADRGEALPSLVSWLKSENKKINGNDNISGTFRHNDAWGNFFDDGPQYDNYPIAWVVNNVFFGVTGYPRNTPNKKDGSIKDYGPYYTYFPTTIGEVKSVYISFKKEDWLRFVMVPLATAKHLVTIFVYSYGENDMQSKGLRRAYFEAYSKPDEYEQVMNLSQTPANSDYRRTLYWNPNVKTDAQGKATVQFMNNSTCRSMMVSAEGFTPDGKPMVINNEQR
jgi:hypothetical protein